MDDDLRREAEDACEVWVREGIGDLDLRDAFIAGYERGAISEAIRCVRSSGRREGE